MYTLAKEETDHDRRERTNTTSILDPQPFSDD